MQRERYFWAHLTRGICITRENANINSPSLAISLNTPPAHQQGDTKFAQRHSENCVATKPIPVTWAAIFVGTTLLGLPQRCMWKQTVPHNCVREGSLFSRADVIPPVSQHLRVWSQCQGNPCVNQSLAGKEVGQTDLDGWTVESCSL